MLGIIAAIAVILMMPLIASFAAGFVAAFREAYAASRRSRRE